MGVLEIVATIGAVLVFVLLAVRTPTGVCALLAFYPLMPSVPRSPVAGLNAETILLSFAMILTLGPSRLRLPPLRVTGPVLAFLAVMFAAWVIGGTQFEFQDPVTAAWESFKSLKSRTFAVLLFFIAYWWIRNPAEQRRMLEGLSAAVLIVAVAALGDLGGGGTGRASGLFPNANTTGDILSVFLLAPLHLVWHERTSRSRRLFHALVYTAGFVALLYTLSRGAWLAFAIGHVIYFLFVDRRILVLGAATAAVMLTIALPLAPDAVQNRIASTFETGGKVYQVGGSLAIEASAASRVVLYRIGFDMFVDSPVWGHGANAFRAQSRQYGAKYGLLRASAPHSFPLALLTESGLLGLIVLGWLSATVLLLAWALMKRRGSRAHLGILLLGLGMATGVANLFHTDFLTNPVSARFFWAAFGMCARSYFAPVRTEA